MMKNIKERYEAYLRADDANSGRQIDNLNSAPKIVREKQALRINDKRFETRADKYTNYRSGGIKNPVIASLAEINAAEEYFITCLKKRDASRDLISGITQPR